jgi:hypothetical protein
MDLFENEYVRLSIDESVPCLEWIGKKYMPSEAFRTSEEKSLQLYRESKKKYPQLEWLVDARDIGVVSSQDMQWVIDKILPRFALAGLTKEGFVVPKSAIGKMTVKNYISAAGKTIEMKVFDTVEAAKNWLKE